MPPAHAAAATLHPGRTARLDGGFVCDWSLVLQAQALRHQLHAQEMGRGAAPAEGPERDADRFAVHCDHFVVRDLESGRVVATYSLLAPAAARLAGGYRAEEHFDLSPVDLLRGRMVEIDGFCAHPAYRSTALQHLMWSALARYLLDSGHDYVLGSARILLADGGHGAASIHRSASAASPSPDDLRVLPHCALPLERLRDTLPVPVPPLLQAYLDNGAWVCGEPAWDRAFDCAELPLLLHLSRMRARYVRGFLARAA